jgi:hypothetical protein
MNQNPDRQIDYIAAMPSLPALLFKAAELYNSPRIDSWKIDSWKLTGAAGDTIIYQHQYPEEAPCRDVLFNAAVVNYFAARGRIGFSGHRRPGEILSLVREIPGRGPDVFGRVAAGLNQEIEKAGIFLMR